MIAPNDIRMLLYGCLLLAFGCTHEGAASQQSLSQAEHAAAATDKSYTSFDTAENLTVTNPAETPSPMAESPTAEEEQASSSADIQERGLPIKRLPDGDVAPKPSGMAPPTGFVGATENITKVGRAIQVKTKSLTMLVTVAPGVAVTQPVTISIALGGYGPTRQTQSYVPSTGNRFLYNDPEGDGKPRSARVEITLSEPKPGGGVYTSTIPGSVMLDPLYDVAISPLEFSLIENCDLVGLSEIRLRLFKPDKFEEVKFNTKAGRSISFGQFAWTRSEVSGSAKLHRPHVAFYESDGGLPEFIPGTFVDKSVNLVPGKTETRAYNVRDTFKDCRAYVKYTITYKLRWYPHL